jgi:Spy/CpxP family protein refolding chaperone
MILLVTPVLRHARWLGFAVLTIALATSSLHAAGTRGRWWRSATIQQRLALTTAQVEQIDAVFERSVPKRRLLRRRLQSLQDQLDRAITAGARDEDAIQRLIDRVADAERVSNVARTMMLVRIYAVLTPRQRTSLERVSLASNESDSSSDATPRQSASSGR